MRLPVMPPVKPMLAKAARELPPGDAWQFEPKWDGFRCIVFRDGDEVELGSRNEKPLTRYFPEVCDAVRQSNLPQRVVLDGEIVIPCRSGEGGGLDFDALLQRIHPAESRVRKLAEETPASYVAFDILAVGDQDAREVPLRDRRPCLEGALGGVEPPIYLTPATQDRALAGEWFSSFDGAGLDGVIAKKLDDPYCEDQRVGIKVKHERTADCAVAGFRWHKSGDVVGSLLLGLYDEAGTLHHVGVVGAFPMAKRRELVEEIAPLREKAVDGHPWGDWAAAAAEHASSGQRMPGATSRWNSGRDLSWVPLKVERVIEVAYDQLQGNRFRHAAQFRRWRPDRTPDTCTYAQLEVVPPQELSAFFAR